jgi:hypothetical protein
MSNDGCLVRPKGRSKTASATVYLVEELGDARMRCDQLMRYIAEAMRLVDASQHREHFFEVAGHLIQAVPTTAFKLQKALQAVALAANRIDYEELKTDLRPEKVEQLESVLEDVRIRQVQHRSEPPMTTNKDFAQKLRQIAATTRAYQLPQHEVVKLIVALGQGQKTAEPKVPTADHLDRFAEAVERDGAFDQQRLAACLRRMVGDVHVTGHVAAISQHAGNPIFTQAGSREDVMDGFKKENPKLTKEQLEDIADKWEEHRNVVKDKTAADPQRELDQAVKDLEFALKAGNRAFHVLGDLLPDDAYSDLDKALKSLAKIRDRISTGKKASDDLRWKVGAEDRLAEIPLPRLERAVDSVEEQARTIRHGLDLYKKDAQKYLPQIENIEYAAIQLGSASRLILRAIGSKKTASDEDKQSKFEEGKPADPTENMSPEDAKKWKTEHDKNKGNFKAATADAPIRDTLQKAYFAGKESGEVDEHELKGALSEVIASAKGLAESKVSPLGPPLGHMHNVSSSLWELAFWLGGMHSGGVKTAADDPKQSKFEEGKPADPTENMSPEDAKKWKTEHDKNKGNFKAGSDWEARELKDMEALLKGKGYDPKNAKKLQKEGMGTYELEERLKKPGDLERTHGLKKEASNDLRWKVGTTEQYAGSPIFTQAGSREDVMDGFKKENPKLTKEQLEEIGDQWEKNKSVVKDK